MMADSVEAASRSLPEYTEESISNLVDKIIDSQVEEGYFRECPRHVQGHSNGKSRFQEKLKPSTTPASVTRNLKSRPMKIVPKNSKERNFCCKANGFNCIRLKVSVSWNATPGRRIRISRQEKPNTVPEYSFST